MASTLTTFDFALKERYTDKKVENLCFAERTVLGMLAKDEEFQGDGEPVPVIHAAPQGIAVVLATAQGNASNVVGKKFVVTAGDLSGSVDIGDKVIMASRGNPGAFLQNKAAEIDGLYEQMSDVLAIAIASNGGNSIGYLAAAPGSTTYTLSNASDTVNFEVDMELNASLNDGSSTSHALLASAATVTAVDRNAGTVTVGTNPWSGAGAGIYLFREGTFYGNVGDVITFGIPAYVWSDATPPALYSMTRTSDVQRLAGGRVPSADLSGLGIEERIQKLGAYATGRWKGPGYDCFVMHPEEWQNLAIALQSRGQRSLTDNSTSFGYEYLEVIAGGKRGKVFADRFFPRGHVFGLSMKSWKLKSMGKLIHALSGDGLNMLRKSTTNDYEYRLVSYPGLACNAPGNNGRAPTA